MKKIFIFLLTVVSLVSFGQGKKYMIPAGSDGGVFRPSLQADLKLQNGDTVIVPSCTYFYPGSVIADSAKKIVFDGRLAKVNGYDFKDCKGIKLLNGITGAPGVVGISLHGYVNHIEIEGGEVANSEYGMWCKNEPRTFDDSIYSHTILNDVYVHDVYFHDIAQHMGYFGATQYPNTSRGALVNGVTYYFQPSLLSNIRIIRNKIRRMGKNGPMLCLAMYGQNEIAYNDIDTVGTGQYLDQGTGIAVGGFSSNIWVHDNSVKHSWQPNIWDFGGKNVVIENNICAYAGNTGTATQTWPENIRLTVDANYKDTVKFSINNNVTTYPGSIGIYKGTGLFSTSNVICGNVGTIKVDAGVSYSTSCNTPIPMPIPTKTIFHKGYFTLNSKRFYYVMYSDGTYAQTNSKYQPL
jgi:hypothetical protein